MSRPWRACQVLRTDAAPPAGSFATTHRNIGRSEPGRKEAALQPRKNGLHSMVALARCPFYVRAEMTEAFDPGFDQERLEQALQAAGLGEFQWNVGASTLWVSERMSAITGFPAGEARARIGGLIEHLVHPDDVEDF